MIFKNLCILVLWMKVASTLGGSIIKSYSGLSSTKAIEFERKFSCLGENKKYNVKDALRACVGEEYSLTIRKTPLD